MARIAHSVHIDPRALSAAERHTLADTLVDVFAEVFDGVDHDYVRRTIVDAPTERTALLLQRNDEGKVVSCFAVRAPSWFAL
jgi:hypothetical protein